MHGDTFRRGARASTRRDQKTQRPKNRRAYSLVGSESRSVGAHGGVKLVAAEYASDN